jgi:hypothetical protein
LPSVVANTSDLGNGHSLYNAEQARSERPEEFRPKKVGYLNCCAFTTRSPLDWKRSKTKSRNVERILKVSRSEAAMFRNLLTSTAIACAVILGAPALTFAQETRAKEDAKKAGQEAKEAGKDAGQAAKDAGKATAKGTKHVAKKTAQVTEDAAKETATGTKKAAKKTKDAVTPDTTTATCNDGTVQQGKTKTTACANHGGEKG